jgi:transposase InsO family protein
LTVVPPGVELTLDTTDLDLFDIPLKLIAAQDPGRRDEELYEAFHLDVPEDAHRVAAVVDAATRHRSFALAVTDQGTPYCAHEAKQAYEARGLEHAPTKEAAPTQKAPLERSFRTLKSLLAPLAAATSMLAAQLPSLRSEDLAKTVGRYLVALAVDAYRVGAASRATQAAAPLDRAAVHAAAEAWVQRRRAEHGSRKLFLARIHEEYRMDGARDDFVRAFRRHELEDIEEAERRLRAAACRCHARVCDRYFAGILSNVMAR